MQLLWDHYSREELPFKDFSTQDAYTSYAANWILPRWGDVFLNRVKTVEIERWLRDATGSNGTKAMVKCVMSALSHMPCDGNSRQATRSLQEFLWVRVASEGPARVFA